MGDVAAALGLFERSLAIAPDYFIALRDKGIVLGLLGRKREAAECLSRSLRMNPTNWPAGFWLRKFASPEEAAALIEEVRPDRSGSCAAPPQPAQEEKTRHGEVEVIGNLLGAAEHRRQMVDIWRRLSARSAHRIGNQLFAARGALRTLEQLRDPQSAEAVLDLRASLQRIAGVTREFQTFSSNEPPRRRITEIGPLVRDIARRYGALAEGTAVTARVADDLPRCSLDRTQMDDALGELVENALHQTPRGGRVTLSAEAFHEEGEPRVRILVEDTGPGIAPQVKQRLFEPFVTTRPGGSGLGLAIVKQIVENHGGTIRETGKPGEGARFEVQLPALPSEEARP
jgi:signal transduction histidine kinase